MGVYIPGMEMPKDRGVYIAIDIDGQVYTKPLGALKWQRLEQKAIPVPPHGKLIDADALYEDCALDRNYDVAATTTRINEYMQLKIDSAPTIIPAEEDSGIQKEFMQNWHEEDSE